MAVILSAKPGGSGGGGGGSLPSWWVVNSGAGTESVDFEGAVEISPERDVSSLILRGFAGNTEHILQVFDDAGDLAVDIDSTGILDVRQIAIQDPPDTGPATGGSSSHVHPSFWEINSGNDASVNPLRIQRYNGVDHKNVFQIGRTGAIVQTSPVDNTTHETAIEMAGSFDTLGNAIELWDFPFNNMLFSVSYTGAITATLPTVNPGPGGLWNDGGTVKVGT